MITKPYTLKRGPFKLEVENIDLSSKGIYQLKGENGSGKTSFIESILKTNRIHDIDPKIKQQLISYFSQKLYTYPISSRKYLKGCNQKLVEELCEYFYFDQLDKEIPFLSGGEFVVLSLIRCFAKDTPILILDEPTNNLDNEMTKKVEALIIKTSKTKTVILSSHDERLELPLHSIINVIKGKVMQEADDKSISNTLPLVPAAKIKRKIFRDMLLSKFNILMFTVVLFCGLLTSMLAANYLLNELPAMEKIPYNNAINLMWIDEDYSTYIEAVASPSELEKQYIGKNNTMNIQELMELSKKEYVEDIYVVDTGYLATLQMDTSSSLKLFSLPQIISTHPLHYGAYPGCKKFLLTGRLPRDNSNEAMISYEQMQKNFGYSGDVNDIIGKKISINGKRYIVVGLTSLPYVSISFDKNSKTQYGVIRVSENARKALNQDLEQMKKLNYGKLIFEDIFIQYDTKHTNQIMKYLKAHAPSYQYSSTYVDSVIEKEAYIKMLPKLVLLSFGLSIILSILLLIMASKMFVIVGNQIQDLDNMNFQPSKNMVKLIGVFAFDFILMTIVSLLEGAAYLGSFQRLTQMVPFILIDLIVFVGALAIIWKKYKRRD